jgi:glycosyltransferase involved in cell wall biosynthesis
MNAPGYRSNAKILLHIRSLHIGGSERQVVSLAKSMAALGAEVHIAVITSGGPLEDDIADAPNIHLHSVGGLGLKGRIGYLLRLRSLIKLHSFDAVYGFLPTPNLALLVARTIRRRPFIAWGVRSSGLDLSQYSSRVKWAMRLEKWLSRFPDKIITNSQAALEEYRLSDYPYAKLSHIPNAIDVGRFTPDTEARISVRTELEIDQDAPLIGIFARIHPMKDHLTLLKAVKILIETVPTARIICAGGISAESDHYANRIKESSSEMGLREHVLWLGGRNDPERLMAACDLTTLTSDSGEGFPNSVAESLACGIPCVVTDIGDSAAITSEYGSVVPPKNSEALAKAWKSVLDNNRNQTELAQSARQSVIDRYSPESVAAGTLNALRRAP